MMNRRIENYGSVIAASGSEGYSGQLLKLYRNDNAAIGEDIVFVGENGFRAYPSPELVCFFSRKRVRKQLYRIEIIEKKKENIYDVLLTKIQ